MTTVPEWKKRLPNIITFSRMAFVPFIVWATLLPVNWGGWVAAGLFILASATDYFDGALARKYGVESAMGKFMDPVADKVLVSSTLVILIPAGGLDPFMVIILLARDTIIGGLRSVAATENRVIAAGTVGKWKTAWQMIALPCVLIKDPLLGVIPIYEIGYGILWISVLLSVYSGAEYVVGYVKRQKGPTDSRRGPDTQV